jgi:hypothetical protein
MRSLLFCVLCVLTVSLSTGCSGEAVKSVEDRVTEPPPKVQAKPLPEVQSKPQPQVGREKPKMTKIDCDPDAD